MTNARTTADSSRSVSGGRYSPKDCRYFSVGRSKKKKKKILKKAEVAAYLSRQWTRALCEILLMARQRRKGHLFLQTGLELSAFLLFTVLTTFLSSRLCVCECLLGSDYLKHIVWSSNCAAAACLSRSCWSWTQAKYKYISSVPIH